MGQLRVKRPLELVHLPFRQTQFRGVTDGWTDRVLGDVRDGGDGSPLLWTIATTLDKVYYCLWSRALQSTYTSSDGKQEKALCRASHPELAPPSHGEGPVRDARRRRKRLGRREAEEQGAGGGGCRRHLHRHHHPRAPGEPDSRLRMEPALGAAAAPGAPATR